MCIIFLFYRYIIKTLFINTILIQVISPPIQRSWNIPCKNTDALSAIDYVCKSCKILHTFYGFVSVGFGKSFSRPHHLESDIKHVLARLPYMQFFDKKHRRSSGPLLFPGPRQSVSYVFSFQSLHISFLNKEPLKRCSFLHLIFGHNIILFFSCKDRATTRGWDIIWFKFI